MKLIRSYYVFCLVIVLTCQHFCLAQVSKSNNLTTTDIKRNLDYCVVQASKTAAGITDYSRIPRSISNGKTAWRTVDYHDWTSGFWPGIEWYLYEYTQD